jgi:hypothetical protein
MSDAALTVTLLAALVHRRAWEITDALVMLLARITCATWWPSDGHLTLAGAE